MLKVLVLDGGYGGELFADLLESELPIVEVIRVIDWRNAANYQDSPRTARKAALRAIRPYIGRVNLIVFANYLLTETSISFFQNKFHNQKFTGLKLPVISTKSKQPALILTTKSFTRTISFHSYLFRLKYHANTICLDTWPALIDDGELSINMIEREFEKLFIKHKSYPSEIILTCSGFKDIIPELRRILGKRIRIHDNFNSTVLEICKILKIRGKTGKKLK